MGKEWDSLTRNCMTPQSDTDQQWDVEHSASDAPGTKSGMPRRMRDRPDIGGSLKHAPQMQEWFRTHFSSVLRVLKPGGYMLAFGGTRTYHRLACAVEDAGFEVRDCVMWLYGMGFPKGQGCLKPAYEPILLCRRPGPRVLPLGIDECRVGYADLGDKEKALAGDAFKRKNTSDKKGWSRPWMDDPARVAAVNAAAKERAQSGRWPANVLHDGSDDVLEAFAAFGPTSTTGQRSERSRAAAVKETAWGTDNHKSTEYANEPPGTAARFFYCAKASRAERLAADDGTKHQTVKPLSLMKYLVRLVTPPGGLVLDPFAGSGTTGLAALAECRRAILIEREAPYVEIIHKRLAAARADAPLFAGGDVPC